MTGAGGADAHLGLELGGLRPSRGGRVAAVPFLSWGSLCPSHPSMPDRPPAPRPVSPWPWGPVPSPQRISLVARKLALGFGHLPSFRWAAWSRQSRQPGPSARVPQHRGSGEGLGSRPSASPTTAQFPPPRLPPSSVICLPPLFVPPPSSLFALLLRFFSPGSNPYSHPVTPGPRGLFRKEAAVGCGGRLGWAQRAH